MTVYFLTSDTQVPYGGIRQCYRAVDALNDAGVPAAVVHLRGSFRARWFDNSTTIVGAGSVALSGADIVVVTEYLASDILPVVAPGVRKVLFNQAPYIAFRNTPMPVTERDLAPFKNPELVGCVTVSRDAEELVTSYFPWLPTYRVRLGVDVADHAGAAIDKRPIICLAQRKRPNDARLLMALLHAQGTCKGWQFRLLENMDASGVATTLRQSALYLHLPATPGEGFSLVVAEAMSARASVIGYSGHGASELMTADTAIVIEEGDILRFAREVGAACESFGTPSWTYYRQRIDAAYEAVISSYTPRHYASDMVHAIRQFSASPEPMLATSVRMDARLLGDHRSLKTARRLASLVRPARS